MYSMIAYDPMPRLLMSDTRREPYSVCLVNLESTIGHEIKKDYF